MAGKTKQTFWKIKVFMRSPQSFSLFIVFVITIIIFGVNAFFAPPLLTAVLIVAFIGVFFFVTRVYLKMAGLNQKISLKDTEFQALINSLKDGVIIYNADFEILEMNSSAEEMTGITSQEIVGRKVTPQMIRTPKLGILTQILYPTLAPSATDLSTDTWPQMIRIETANPQLKLFTALNKLSDKSGGAPGFIKVIRDETRESKIVESKGEFVSVAAHNLRTPLTALNWSLESLTSDLKDNPEIQEKVKNASDIAERMIKTVEDLLNIAKIEEGKFGYQLKEVDLSEFINQIVSHVKPVAEKYGIEIRSNIGRGGYKVKIDPDRFGMVVTNILDNAIRYNTKGGNISISIEEEKGFVKIGIADTGIGIPQEDLKKIFEKFHRSSNAIQAEPNGTGLGLYIAKNIMKKLGGEISVQSALGRGTTFRLTLPLKN